MAYRPPTRSAPTPVQNSDEGQWQTVRTKTSSPGEPSPWGQSALRRIMKPEVKEPTVKSGPKQFEDLKEDDFPSLGGGKSIPVKSSVSKSSSTESMAERMKKKMKEEEEERTRKELEKQKEEEEKQNNDFHSILPGTFISHTRLMKRFEDEKRYGYTNEDDGYDNRYDIDYDGYGYRPTTPPYPLHSSTDDAYNNEYDEEDNDY